MSQQHALDYFKFYEAAAEKTKTHAWSQTTWILTLNAGIMAFSTDFYANHGTLRGLRLIEGLAAGVGLLLCVFLLYLLQELGGHIRHYWTTSNQLASRHSLLRPFISQGGAKAATKRDYSAEFPAFCRRLQALALLFLLGHVGWLMLFWNLTA